MSADPPYARLDGSDLLAALRTGEIVLHYQPKLSLDTGKVVGVEALARWFHPVHGMVPPSHFVPLAETGNLIDDLTAVVVDLAANEIDVLAKANFPISVAVNVSAANLDHLDFPDRIEEACLRHCGSCERLTVELTESAQQSVTYLLDTLTRLRIKGTSLSLDDFGTGYSSLVQLHQLPFSEMKIDRSFVVGMATSRECRAIVKSIIDLAHNLSLSVVAEGVETAEAIDMLRSLGCDAAQGYYIAKPMPDADLMVWLKHRLAAEPHGASLRDPAAGRAC
jgi:EAL domain-containing protein (putative c-di-GMP-specific phosphodiesterase class I)